MKRFVRDPELREFHRKIDAEVRRIGTAAKGLGYVVYAIFDPSLSDPHRRGSFGPPIYVGQSKGLVRRARAHMRDGGGGTQSTSCKTGRIRQIMSGWRVPRFEILDTAPTHLTSLIAETIWARRFAYLGYELANMWSEHRSRMRPHGIDDIPTKRMWELTVGEAIDDDLAVEVGCRKCGYVRPLNLAPLQPSTSLRAVRSADLQCSECLGRFVHIQRPNAATWKWAGYTPRSMPDRGTPFVSGSTS